MKVLLLILTSLLICCCSKQEKPIIPKVGTITVSIYASATIQPDSAYTVFSSVSGILEKVYISEGDLVSIDSPLFTVSNSVSKTNAQNAALTLEVSRQRLSGAASILKSLQEDIDALTLVVQNDSINFERQERLWKNKIGSLAQYESKKLKLDQSRARLNTLRSNYNLKKIELQSNIQQAQNNYKAAQSQDADFTIRSKISGKVYEVLVNAGEIITPQKGLAYLGSTSNFIIEMLVDEVDIIQVALEQEVVITLEAYPNKTFIATVSKIYPQKDLRSQTFKIEARFIDPPKTLYAGLSGEANIITSIKENALIIPKSYVIDNRYVETNLGRKIVTFGLQSIDSVEVLSGITAQTQLFKPE